jgi:predicted DsbA family dithiol-disulfide isomerase
MKNIEVWMDVVCPWSRLALIELDRTIAENNIPARVRLRNFRIDPEASSNDYGQTTIEHLCFTLNITPDKAFAILEGVINAGTEQGVTFNFETARGGNTLDSHRLIQVANKYSLSIPVALAISKAHFEDGKLPGELGLLVEIARQVGLPEDAIQKFETINSYNDEVLADEESASELNIESRPTIFINGELAFVGLPKQTELLAVLTREL